MRVLSRVFRGKFVAGLRRAFRRNKLGFYGACQPLAQEKAFAAFLRTLFRQDWVVYAKTPFGGPEHVLQYLARYTHRVAISNHRLRRSVTIRTSLPLEGLRPSQQAPHHDARRTKSSCAASCSTFCRRGFPRIRYFGWLANRRRGALLPLCRTLLAVEPLPVPATPAATPILWLCPCCQGPMRVIERLTAQQLREEVQHLDSS